MKNFKLLLIGLAVIFAMTGCGESSEEIPSPDPGTGTGSVIGDWHMTSWSSLAAADVYLSFSNDGTFKIYQRVYTPEYVYLNGTYTYEAPALGGKYSDNVPWGSSYKVWFNSDGTQMTLTSTTSGGDISVFAKATIPADVISGLLQVNAMQEQIDIDTHRFL